MMASSSSRVLSASSSMLSSNEWSEDESGLNTGFFETSDYDSETDSVESPKKKILKKSSPKKRTFSRSESDVSIQEDTKKITSTPMRKYSVAERKAKENLLKFLVDFSMQETTKAELR